MLLAPIAFEMVNPTKVLVDLLLRGVFLSFRNVRMLNSEAPDIEIVADANNYVCDKGAMHTNCET